MNLRRFFDDVVRRSLGDLSCRDDPAADYLADLLTRFARTDSLYPPGTRLRRLESVADTLLEIQDVWDDASPNFRPEQEVALRRHIGDYTLFMTGIFHERVEHGCATRYYIAQGKRAYQFVAEHERSTARSAAPLFRRLSDQFEGYVGVLDYARRVHFHDHPEHPFFRLGFG
jgi:hypothetical protein